MTSADVLNAVVAAAANTYRWTDTGPVSTHTDDPTLLYNSVLPKIPRLEKVFIRFEDFEGFDPTPIQDYRASGTDFWVLVPLKAMGDAHVRFRGIADRIQPWWFDRKSNIVKFGKAEIP